jgi:surface protein
LKTLLQTETVSKTWRKLCTKSLRNICCGFRTAFQSKQELKDTIRKYSLCKTGHCDRDTMEEIAFTYGYPIGTWDVSQVTDMSSLFEDMDSFNEYIGSWDVSNVTDMNQMFVRAKDFNQDMRSWNVSNVADMSFMFYEATAFNQEIGNWNTSRVTTMRCMFY